uniref:Putative major capsid protein n=1 Tax=viral metagenome TaxID=1070528 RepID=A0A6H1ZTV7_9ZZZZ
MATGPVDNHNILSSWDIGQGSATAGNYEDVLDMITIMTPTETPFLSGLAKTVVRGTTHEVMLDSLASFGDVDVGDADVEVVPESYDATFTVPSSRKRIKNYTHILRKTVDVSDTQRAVNTIGIADEYIYQIRKMMIEWARDAEFAVIHSHMNAQAEVGNVGGTPATGRKMEGILNYIEPDPAGVTTNYLDAAEEGTITEAGSPLARLSEAVYNDHLQAMWDKGCLAKTAYVNTTQKREISGWVTNATTSFSTRNLNAENMRIVSNIDVYKGDFGEQAIVLHRYIPKREVLTMDEDYSRIGVLRPVMVVELARMGNSTRSMIEGEITYECLAPSSLGKIVWCSAHYGRTD